MKFRFNSCWHCGEQRHSRRAKPEKDIKGCPKFDKLKAANGDKPPAGYKGAYEKARDLAWEKFSKKPGGTINELYDDTEGEDSESDADTPGSGIFAVKPQSYVHPNPFADLADDDDVEDLLDDDVVEHFKSWANKVEVKPKAKPKGPVRIASLKQLDKFVSQHPMAGSNPSSVGSKKLLRSLRKLPQQISLENDDCLALVDSGSSINAADATVHFPSYVNKVRQTGAQKRGEGATTAGGHHLRNEGKFVVDAVIDGQNFQVPFTNMKVKLPILSVRHMMTRGSQMLHTDTGGVIHNPMTDQAIKLIVHDGLWFAKMKVKGERNPPPPEPVDRMAKKAGFARRGANA